jgi:hypothetical protein
MLVAALAAALLSGCGGAGGSASSGASSAKQASGPKVTLDLKGGRSEQIEACGSSNHYTVYSSGSPIEFAGAVSPVPAGRWKIKVKLKSCRGSAFQDAQKVEATRDKHTGAFRGTLPGLPRGTYFARAALYENGQAVARSDKGHFAVR